MRRVALAAAVVALAAMPAAALASGGDVGGGAGQGIGTLAPVDSVPDAPVTSTLDGTDDATDDAGTTTTTDPGATTTPTTESEGDAEPEITGSLEELRILRAHTAQRRDRLQARLVDLENAREDAEERLDAILDEYMTRLADLYDAGASERMTALMAVRKEQDPAVRASLVAELVPADRALANRQSAALVDVDTATAAADDVRARVLALGARLDAIDAAIKTAEGPDAEELLRQKGKRYSVRADYVFTTGPIPGIGYYGDIAGGGMLSGWNGFAGSALGGVGCSPPSKDMRATGQIERGDASWYGPGFDGNGTANGEVYDQEAFTAAHKSLPFGTIVRVTSSSTGRCVFVRINDRGPYVDGRIIDLSHAAAQSIGMDGVSPVQIEVWSTPGAETPASVTPPAATPATDTPAGIS